MAGRVLLHEIQEKVDVDNFTGKFSKFPTIFDISKEIQEISNIRLVPSLKTSHQERDKTSDERLFVHEESETEEYHNVVSGYNDADDDSSTPEKKVPADSNVTVGCFSSPNI